MSAPTIIIATTTAIATIIAIYHGGIICAPDAGRRRSPCRSGGHHGAGFRGTREHYLTHRRRALMQVLLVAKLDGVLSATVSWTAVAAPLFGFLLGLLVVQVIALLDFRRLRSR